MLATTLITCLIVQDPDPKPVPPTQEKKPVEAALVELTDQEARTAVADLKKALKGRRVSMGDRLRAVEALAGRTHKRLVPPLADIVMKEKSVVVRKRAVEVLAQQPDKEANRAFVQLMKKARVQGEPTVYSSVILGLSETGYTERQWDLLDGEFEREYSEDRVPVQEAILKLVTDHKEKQAVDMLLENLDEPIPVDVDSPTNPPASYWEGRWKAWNVWRDKVKEALYALTGQRFSTRAEARAWIRKNGLK